MHLLHLLYKPDPPLNNHALSLPFPPSLSALSGALSPSQDTTDDCPLHFQPNPTVLFAPWAAQSYPGYQQELDKTCKARRAIVITSLN